jgi:hypothetical protein
MIILSWLKSTAVDAPKRALEVFEMMQAPDVKAKVDIEPDYRTFSLLCEILGKTMGREFAEKYNFFVEECNRLEKSERYP